jgi:hypothetical protein
MAVRVDTSRYEWTYGHKPRQPRGQAGAWAFHLDGQAQVVWVRGTYREALAAAKRQARYSVQVLP